MSPLLSLSSSRVLTSISSGFFNLEASSSSERTLYEPLTLPALDILIEFWGFSAQSVTTHPYLAQAKDEYL